MYGGGYGGYGGMGYGYTPGMGMGMGMGLPGQPLDPSQSLTAQLSNTTQQTFQLLHSIVQTFGGFAQMLESTFMATHSSFFAMVGVVDQFAALRDILGQVLGVFGLLRWVKGVLSGEGVVPRSAMTDEFNHFVNRPPGAPALPPGVKPPKPSKKPIIVFLLAIFGIPYLMHKLIRRLAERPAVLPPGIDPSNPQALTLAPNGEQILDPSKMSFAHALYPFSTNQSHELNLKKGDIVAIISRNDPVTGLESEWWRGRTRDGKEGWFPKAFVEIIQKKVSNDPNAEKVAKKVD
jgi:peroxin-13